jgi:ATP-dependent DNA ligase
MKLPVLPPVKPMLAKAADSLPEGDVGSWLFEPKWDGFRCIVFRDGDDVELGSRNEKPLNRYFPEVVEALKASLPDRCVVDGEIVLVGPEGLDFDALQQRVHPAASRVNKLAAETPCSFVGFDLLAIGDRDLMGEPLSVRRPLLVEAFADATPPVHLTPATVDRALAEDWFVRFEGAGLDGVLAKALSGVYLPDKRAQLKVKHQRTADVVVAGFRMHKDGEGVGSLMLGLYDDDGRLHNLGVASSFTAARRRELLDEVADLVVEPDDMADHPWGSWAEAAAHEQGARLPGAQSRWNAGKDLSFTALRPDRVAEVAFERVDNGRFRHSTRLLRWRPDRTPDSCTFEQLEVVPPHELADIFGVGD